VREKVIPFLSPDLFEEFEHKELVTTMIDFNEEYSMFPTVADLKLKIKQKEVYEELKKIVSEDISTYSLDALMGEMENFFKERLIWNTVSDVAEKLGNKDIGGVSEAPDKLRTALAFSFNTEVGLDIFSDPDRMYKFLTTKDKVVSTGLPCLNRLIGGGFHEKNLHLILASVNTGKSLVKCAFAANALMQNKNVLYISLEMQEERITERVLQNILDIKQKDLGRLSRDEFGKMYADINKKIKTKLLVKEYPTKGANVNSFRNLLKEIELKKKFIPDIIFIDYLGITASNHMNKNDNTYTEGKRISEDMRGLAVETGIPIVSSIQTNRGGMNSTDVDMDDVADSIGTTATADLIIAVTQSDELREQGKYSFCIIKNRFGINKIKLIVGVDYEKMRIFDDGSNVTPTEKKEVKGITTAKDIAMGIVKRDKTEQKKKIYTFK